MDLTADQIKSWIEELIGKNRILEEENKLLIQQRISAETNRNLDQAHGHDQNLQTKNCVPEQEVKDFKSDILALEQENESLKSKILELVNKVEILEQKMSNMADEHGQEENLRPRKQRKIDCDDGVPGAVSSGEPILGVTNNPLEIEEIVRIILGHVKPLDLLKCRQVSKLWNNAARKHFQEKLIFHVNAKEYSDRDVELFLTHSATSFPMFRNLTLDLERRSCHDSLKLMTQLFANHGKFLHKLQLNFTGNTLMDKWTLDDFRVIFLSSLDEIRELKINMLCHFIHEDQIFYPHHVKKILPKLTTLNIGLNCSQCNLNNHGNTQVFADLLRMAPNLKTLYWRSWDSKNEEQDGSRNFIESLLLINPIGLENLFIYSVIADDLALSIANSNLNLKQLYLVEFRGFGVHFLSAPTPVGKCCEITPKKATYSGGQIGPDLKTDIEILLAKAQFRNVPCTNKLRVFASQLTRRLNQGQ